jgi:hypothetical protein
VAAALFGEDYATLLMGTVRIQAQDPAIYPNSPVAGTLHTEERGSSGFDTPKELSDRFGWKVD